MNSKPLISVIMPAFNAAAFIAEGIDSILAQEHRPIEVIVVDDGSTDDTASIAAGFGSPVRCCTQKNTGPPSARNKGLSMARGDLIAFLDADDVYEPGKLELQVKKLEENPQVDVVVGKMVRLELASAPDEPLVFVPIEQDDHVNLQLGTALFRRAAFDKVGFFDVSLLATDDWDWFMRARELKVGLLMHKETVLKQRLHRTNITRDRVAGMHFLALMLKRSIDRRRAQGTADSLPKLANYEEPVSKARSKPKS